MLYNKIVPSSSSPLFLFLFLLLILLFFCVELICGGAFNDQTKEKRQRNLPPATQSIKLVDDDKATLKKLASAQTKKIVMRKCQCGRTQLSTMMPLMLTNLGDNKPIRLWLEKDRPLGKGTYSKVFHAELAEIGGQIFNKCVALKMTLKDVQDSDWQKHIKEWNIQRAFDALEVRRRSHVIKLFAFGYHKMDNRDFLFSVLELGRGGDLDRHMRRRRYEWFKNNIQPDDRSIEADIRQLAETVRDMHQKIMHLDLKPTNLVFVREDNGGPPVMKAIDFGASEFIDEHEQVEERNANGARQANACKWFVSNDPLTTEWYQRIFKLKSPEHYNQCNWKYSPEKEHSMELSSKSDIWALGIIAIEMAAIGAEFDEGADAENDFAEIIGKVHSVIAELWQIYIQDKNDIKKRMEQDWEEFYSIFSMLLSVRARLPRLFYIVTATLVYEPEQRPTANGILDFLDGKCHFFESMEHTPRRLFPWLTMDKLRAQLIKQRSRFLRQQFNNAAAAPAVKEALRKQMKEAETLLRLANASEWQPPTNEGKQGRGRKACDTTTNSRPRSASDPTNDGNKNKMPSSLSIDAAELVVDDDDEDDALSHQHQFMGWKSKLAKIDKTIGLSVSPRIQTAYELVTTKYSGLLENLQEAFYVNNFEIVLSMGKGLVGLLWTIGYGNLLAQLDAVSERYKNDAKMLRRLVAAVRKHLGAEWEEIYEMAAQYECDHRDASYVNSIDQLSALYLYELMYKLLLDQFSKRSDLRAAIKQSARASFLFQWLQLIVKNLNKFRAEKENGILKTLKSQREQFEKRKDEFQKEMEQIVEKRHDEYKNEFDELDEIEQSVEEEMKLIRHDIEQNKDKVPKQKQQERGKKTNQENAADAVLNQNFELLMAKKESEEMLAEVSKKRAFLQREFEDEMMRIQLNYEKEMDKLQQGLTLCILVERKIDEFNQTV